jgi:hypothetical protein
MEITYISADEVTSQMWYISGIEYYLPIRRNEVVLPATARMNLVKKKKVKKANCEKKPHIG